jgi:hypothetical protein
VFRYLSFYQRAILFAFAVKFFYLLIGNLFPGGWNGWEHVLDVLSRNDSGWYHQIARDGYPVNAPQPGEQSPFAFFPLYPGLIALLRPVFLIFTSNTDLVFVLSAFSLHVVTTLLWVRLAFQYLETLGLSPKQIFIFLALFQCFPFHYFHHVFYSEQLFTVLVLWLLFAAHKLKMLQTAAAAFLLTLCRPTGIVISVGVGFLVLQQSGWWAIFKTRRNLKVLFSLIAAPLALLLWLGYLQWRCGDALAFSHSQGAWLLVCAAAFGLCCFVICAGNMVVQKVRLGRATIYGLKYGVSFDYRQCYQLLPFYVGFAAVFHRAFWPNRTLLGRFRHIFYAVEHPTFLCMGVLKRGQICCRVVIVLTARNFPRYQ